MAILTTTFEHEFRSRLLDLITAQWALLGVPFGTGGLVRDQDIIDPDALVRVSLEFIHEEPRLFEAVLEWAEVYGEYFVRQRIFRTQDVHKDWRAVVWQAISLPLTHHERVLRVLPVVGPPNVDVEALLRFIWQRRADRGRPAPRVGRFAPGTPTLMLAARDLLGQEARHLLLVYLLARPHGGKLREVEAWCGIGYRTLIDTATRWAGLGVISLDHGFCRLRTPELWQTLLNRPTAGAVLVGWPRAFDTAVRLLREWRQLQDKGLSDTGPVAIGLISKAHQELQESVISPDSPNHSSLGHLLAAFKPL